MELYEAVCPAVCPSIVLKCTVKGDLFGVKQHTHPLLPIDISLRLEVVGAVVRNYIEAKSVFQDWLHLTCQQVDRCGRFALVSVTNLQESVPDVTPPLLPDVPETSLRSLVEVS